MFRFRSIRLKEEALRSHRVSNALQTVLLFGGMLGFLGLLGFLIAGFPGVLWALVFGLASFYVPSSMLNAFVVNVTGVPAIGVTDGLLRSLDTRQLAAVLAHGIGHIRNRDLAVMGLAGLGRGIPPPVFRERDSG